ncbi:hypothetical protein Dda_4225 [Drechslerella dactyloides]|uniref:Uncharacterized protein n=1 Tax=Drechslerella dactyloides TaxID=74499 RepID=A0AAD6J1P0_DREDA|nr:hypothetical protein Dda_4225 [Drechslerella dactyloides]
MSETLEKRGGYERLARKELLEADDAGCSFLLGIPRRRKKTSPVTGRRDPATTDNRAEKTRITGKPPNCGSKMPMGTAVKAADDGGKRKRVPYAEPARGKMKSAGGSRVSKAKPKAGMKGTTGRASAAGHNRKTGGQRRGRRDGH